MSSSYLIRVACLCLLACLFPTRVCAGPNVVTRAVTARHASFPASVTAAGDSVFPLLTPDGRYVAYMSNAGNLVTNDHHGADFDIFVRDRITRTTVLVSVDASGIGGGNGLSTLGGISADGRYVVFESEASNLVAGDTNRATDVFMRDLQAGTTRLISGTKAGGPSRDGGRSPVMTPDGRWVLFETYSQNLTHDSRDYIGNTAMLWDGNDGSLRWAAPWLVPSNQWQGNLFSSVITTDGRHIAFSSDSTNQVAGTSPNNRQISQIFVRDVTADRTVWATQQAASMLVPEIVDFVDPSLSQDGRRVVFTARGRSVIGMWIFWHDLIDGVTVLVAKDERLDSSLLSVESISTDGARIVYQLAGQLYLWRHGEATNTLLTANHAGTGPANGQSRNAVLSTDERHVVFISDATDLVEDTKGGGFQLYRHDLMTGQTIRLSIRPDGSASDDLNEVLPSISADGRWIAFESTDDAWVSGDDNDASDVFVLDTEAVLKGDFAAPELVSRREASRPSLTSGNQVAGYSTAFPAGSDNLAFDRAGQKLVFVSDATGLEPGDAGGKVDLYVHHIPAGTNQLVSRESGGMAFDYSITADGTKVYCNTLLPHTNGAAPIFAGVMVDLATGRRQMTTTAPISSHVDSGWSAAVSASSDGRYVVYKRSLQYIWRDLVTGGTKTFPSRSAFSSFAISPDGRHVAQASSFSISLWDSVAGTDFLMLASGLGNPHSPVFSADGSLVHFLGIYRTAEEFYPECVYLYSLKEYRVVAIVPTAERNFVGQQPPSQPFLSENNRSLVVVTRIGYAATDTNNDFDVYVYDLPGNTMELVSATRDGRRAGNDRSSSPSISRDGRFVAFLSEATDLTAEDTQGKRQVFLRDLWQKRTILVSENLAGTGGADADSYRAQLSPTGRHLAYLSDASDLVPNDFNLHRDIFLAELPEVSLVDTDGDGMDDHWERRYFNGLLRNGQADLDRDGYYDFEEFVQNTDPSTATFWDADADRMDDAWERRYFGNLDRDGAGDFDGDQLSDAGEYESGLNPALDDTLRVLSAKASAGNVITITWRSVPGAEYQVQYKTNPAQSWIDLRDPVLATRAQTSYSETFSSLSHRRFYRVVRLD